MLLVCVLVCFTFIGLHKCSQLDENFSELRDAKWECDSVCEGSGGKATFDLKNKICKCTLDKNTDEIEEQLILKNANHLGIPLMLTKNIAKRQTDGGDSTLGQRRQLNIMTPRPVHRATTRRPFQFSSIRPFGPNHRLTTPRTNPTLQQRLEQIQKRINDMRRANSRMRSGPHLQQRAGFPADESRPNLMERLRQMQKERQEKQKSKIAASTTAVPNVAASAPKNQQSKTHSSGIVGASQKAMDSTDDKSKDNEPHKNGRKSNFEVITQDPKLYDD